MLFLITGGSGSGKSLLAELMCSSLPCNPLYYLATMKLWDAECEARAEKHRRQRSGKGFLTIEAPDHLAQLAPALHPNGGALLECVSNLVANEQFGNAVHDPTSIVTDGILTVSAQLSHLVVVTNEVCTDIVPQDPAMQSYLQAIGEINCAVADQSDVVVEVCGGIPVPWKGEKLFHEIMACVAADCDFHV